MGVQPVAPASHKTFSRLVFAYGGGAAGLQPLGEGDIVDNMGGVDENETKSVQGDGGKGEKGKIDGGWLENDDIEEF